MGHCGKFGYALQATAADLVISYGPLCGMKQYSKNLYRFLHCGPPRRIWLCAMGHNALFGYAVRAVAQDSVMRYGSWHQKKKNNYQSAEVHNTFQKLSISFKGL
jgi:hypothetical protein